MQQTHEWGLLFLCLVCFLTVKLMRTVRGHCGHRHLENSMMLPEATLPNVFFVQIDPCALQCSVSEGANDEMDVLLMLLQIADAR